jgi:hypothetical protein
MGAPLCCGCQLPTFVPVQIGQGTTVKFLRSFDCFSPKDFDYKIYFNGATAKFNASGTPHPDATNGPAWLVTIPAATTKTQPPGAYRYCERVVNRSTQDTYDLSGEALVCMVVPSAADAEPGAFLTFEEKTVAVLEAALNGDLSAPVQSYSIAGRTVAKYSLGDLRQLLGYYKSVVWRQQHPGRLGVAYAVAFSLEPPATCLPPTWVNVTTLL